MPRAARKKSDSGIYHVMLRGINRQRIFNDDEDYEKFLLTLKKYRDICGYSLLCYCLMPNHVHLLLQEGAEALSVAFRRIGAAYVYWYNAKYNRCGHLFQDRFKSEIVDTDEYLLTVIRYIHWNPVKAGLCGTLEDYPYSSYKSYFDQDALTDNSPLLEIINQEQFFQLHLEPGDQTCLEIEDAPRKRITDQAVRMMMKKLCNCETPSAFMLLPEASQHIVLQKMLAEGASIRQISQLTGLSLWNIRKMKVR